MWLHSVVLEMSVEICSSCWVGPYPSWVGKESDQDISRHTHSASSNTSLDKGKDTVQGMYFAFILSSEVLQHRLIGQ